MSGNMLKGFGLGSLIVLCISSGDASKRASNPSYLWRYERSGWDKCDLQLWRYGHHQYKFEHFGSVTQAPGCTGNGLSVNPGVDMTSGVKGFLERAKIVHCHFLYSRPFLYPDHRKSRSQ